MIRYSDQDESHYGIEIWPEKTDIVLHGLLSTFRYTMDDTVYRVRWYQGC